MIFDSSFYEGLDLAVSAAASTRDAAKAHGFSVEAAEAMAVTVHSVCLAEVYNVEAAEPDH